MSELLEISDARPRIREGLAGGDLPVEGWLALVMTDLTTAARADQARLLTDGPERAEAVKALREALVNVGALAAEAIGQLDRDESWPDVDRRAGDGRRASDSEPSSRSRG